MIKVLFVCMGNICRSPTAHAVFENLLANRQLQNAILVDSAGTHGYHVGMEPDKRAVSALQKRGIDMTHLRARIVTVEDFEKFDYVLAMDSDNLADLYDIAPARHHQKIQLLLSYGKKQDILDVPDPYYGGLNGFEDVIDLVQSGTQGLLEKIVSSHRFQSILKKQKEIEENGKAT